MVAAAVGAAATIATTALSSGATSDAANNAANTQMSMFNTAQNDLAPYLNTGAGAASWLTDLTGSGTGGNPLNSPLLQGFQPTEAQLEQTPGYQFTLEQGLKAAQNSAAARGLGVSGAAMKGAESYATGLADTTYQNAFNDYQTQQGNQFNKLLQLATLGGNAANGVEQNGARWGTNIGSSMIAAGNAQANRINAMSNAFLTPLYAVAGG